MKLPLKASHVEGVVQMETTTERWVMGVLPTSVDEFTGGFLIDGMAVDGWRCVLLGELGH